MLLGPLKVKIQVVRKVGFFVLKRSIFEPRSQRSNPKKDPRSPNREIDQKVPKMGHITQMYKLRSKSQKLNFRLQNLIQYIYI